ncbi:hypothetical protein GCM10009087_02050 [Sphingomonas oligophenolica]|uniref:Sulfotransferase n=1 Tax=Sphingomonas oligophenolica TaxID=301154 RepID=A0ABU9Y0Y8_9SPHN
MLVTLFLFAATVATIELARGVRLLARFRELAVVGGRSARLLPRTGVSEWAKERAMRLMAVKLLGSSLHAGALLTLAGMPLALALAVTRDSPTDWGARALLLTATIGYSLARRRFRIAPDTAEHLLHRLTLGSAPVRDISFDIERAAYRTKLPRDAGPGPIFVTGLARAGTTIVMRSLHESGGFASLSYRDLPLPMAPNSLARLARGAKRSVATQERGHGDGIFHDLDSPEAIEEVFWSHFEGARYRQPQALSPQPVAPDTIAAFRDYVGLVRLRHGGGRYLSKNNNNVLRLPALIEAFPDAVLLHPFRDPLQQAASLRHQHRRACALAEEDPRRASFMTWLGHHEFGRDQRPFAFPGAPGPDEDRESLDYWVKAWISVYRSLSLQPEAVGAQQVFVDYDRLCRGGGKLGPLLTERLGLDRTHEPAGFRPPAPHAVEETSPALIAEAYALHATLVQRAEPTPGFHRAVAG